MGKQSTRRRCVFCGGGPVSREHLWPQWLRKTEDGRTAFARMHEPELEGPRDKLMIASTWVPDASPEGGSVAVGLVPHGRNVPPMDITVKVVCRGCNNGWMSKLESAARVPLEAAMSDHTRPIAADQVDVLRRWATKTAAMFEFNHPPSKTFSTEVLHAIHADTPPPGRWLIGAYHNADSRNHFRATHAWSPLARAERDGSAGKIIGHISQTLLGVGDLLLVVRYSDTRYFPRSMLRGFDHEMPAPLVLEAGSARTEQLPPVSFDQWIPLSQSFSMIGPAR